MTTTTRIAWLIAVSLAAAGPLPAQTGTADPGPSGPTRSAAEPSGSVSPVRWGANGWPVITGDPAPMVESRAPTARNTSAPARGADAGEELPLPSGSDLASPLQQVFRATRPPGTFNQIGGVQVWWQLTIYGPSGEIRGMRNFTQVADCSRPDRDRLELQNGDVFARSGADVSAQRGGIPWDSLQDDARSYLELFGTHVRQPWCFGDGTGYAVVKRTSGELDGQPIVRLLIRERPAPANDTFGPPASPEPCDEFVLGYEPTTGLPRELEHRFVAMGRRRVLLDDWKEAFGVLWPHARIYVDERGQKTTVMTIQRIRRIRVTDADFRL